jgi:hypothetical protein
MQSIRNSACQQGNRVTISAQSRKSLRRNASSFWCKGMDRIILPADQQVNAPSAQRIIVHGPANRQPRASQRPSQPQTGLAPPTNSKKIPAGFARTRSLSPASLIPARSASVPSPKKAVQRTPQWVGRESYEAGLSQLITSVFCSSDGSNSRDPPL